MIFARKILVLLLSLALLLAGVNTLAAGDMSITVSPDGDSETKVNVTGAAVPDAIVLLQVLYNEAELPLPELTPSVTKDMLYYVDSTTADESGAFRFDGIDMGEVSGTYVFRVNHNSGSDALEYSYEYRSPFYVTEVIADINTAVGENDAAALEGLIVTEQDAVGPDPSYLQKITDKDLLSDLCNVFISLGEVADKSDFQKQFLQAALLTYFNSITDKAELKQVMIDCADAAGYAEEAFYAKTFSDTLADTVADKVIEQLSKSAPYEDIAVFNADFMENTILIGVNESAWSVVQSILEENGEEISSDAAKKYASLKKKPTNYANVAKALAGKKFQTLSALADAWEEAIENESDSGSTGGSGGSGSGGSGGSGGSRGSSSGGSDLRWDAVAAPVTPTNPSFLYFDDIGDVDWAVSSINRLAESGIIKGKEPRMFYPNDPITRAEFLSILVNAFGLSDNTAECDFTDVPEDAWFYVPVASGNKLGIAQGIGNGLFGAETQISRQDLCVLVYRALEVKGAAVNGGSAQFADASEIADYAAEAVDALSGLGIVNGVGDGRFDPNGTATRAQAAKIIGLAIDNV